LLAALLATSRKNAATILGLHTQAETMLVDALAIVGLECSFHCYLSICFSFLLLKFTIVLARNKDSLASKIDKQSAQKCILSSFHKLENPQNGVQN
jgi:hypothetical protein